jgi:hypothetical protein
MPFEFIYIQKYIESAMYITKGTEKNDVIFYSEKIQLVERHWRHDVVASHPPREQIPWVRIPPVFKDFWENIAMLLYKQLT